MTTFGNTAAGVNTHACGSGAIRGGVFTLPQAGTVTDIFLYSQVPNGVSLQCAIYNDSNKALMGTSQSVTGSGAAAGWVDFPFSGNGLHLTAGTYQLLWNANGNYTVYDSSTSGGTPINSTTYSYGTWPNPGTWVHASSTVQWSVYAQFNPDASGTVLDGQTLTVEKWQESCPWKGTQWDSWGLGACIRKVKVLGIVRTYMITCLEQNVAWTNSLVQYFEGKINGVPLSFTSTLNVRNVSTSVYVLGVDFVSENVGTQNIRKFTLTLQEQ